MQELSKAGFSDADAVVLDDDEPFQTEATTVASPGTERRAVKTVSLLSGQPNGVVAASISAALESRGIYVDTVTLSNEPKPGLISILDLEGKSYLDSMSAQAYQDLKSFLLKTASAAASIL